MRPSDVKLVFDVNATPPPILFHDLPEGAFFQFKASNDRNKRQSGGLRQKSRGGYSIVNDPFLSPGYFRESSTFQTAEVVFFDVEITARERTS